MSDIWQPEIKKKLDAACLQVFKLQVEITLEPGTTIEGGCYVLDEKQSPVHCTILEAVVLGEEVGATFELDVAKKLGVSTDFVAGFLMGQQYHFSIRKGSENGKSTATRTVD